MPPQLPVPYVSQHADDVPEKWRPDSCAIACVKMAIDYFAQISSDIESVSMSMLIDEGLVMDGFTEYGWKHDVLIALCQMNGLLGSYREEFRDKASPEHEEELREEGFKKIGKTIKTQMPVIVSVKTEKGFHMVLVIGVTDDGFIIHDSAKGPNVHLSKDDFMKTWRGLAVFPVL